MSYLFKSRLFTEIDKGSIEDISIRRLSKLWTNFAKTGDPNSKNNDALLNIQWKPASKSELNFLDFDQTLTALVNPDGDRMAFWEDIYEQYSNR